MEPEMVSTNYSAPSVCDADTVERSIICRPDCIADRCADCQWLRVDRCKLVLPTRQTDADHVAWLLAGSSESLFDDICSYWNLTRAFTGELVSGVIVLDAKAIERSSL